MAQVLPTDFPIDPVTTSGTMLADILNRQAEAIQTSNSGPTAPTETFPGMVWLDTSTAADGVLRIRNAANTAWLDFFATLFTPANAEAVRTSLGLLNHERIVVTEAGANVATSVYADAAGTSSLYLLNEPSAAANKEMVAIEAQQAKVRIASLGTGGADAGALPMEFRAPNFTFNDSVTLKGDIGPHATLLLNKKNGLAASTAAIYGQTNGVSRWQVQVADGNTEVGGNAGSQFAIYRYTDAGALFGGAPAMQIGRSDGRVDFSGLVHTPTQMYADAGFHWSSSLSWGLTADNYRVSGALQVADIFNASIVGASMMCQAIQQPAVASILMFSVGGGGATFNMNGSGQGSSPNGWIATSDKRKKKEFQPITDALAKVKKLNGMTFLRTDTVYEDGSKPRKAGYIAQEVQAVLPEAVIQLNDEEKTLGVDHNGLIGLLIEAVKALTDRVHDLETGAPKQPKP